MKESPQKQRSKQCMSPFMGNFKVLVKDLSGRVRKNEHLSDQIETVLHIMLYEKNY